MKLTEAFRLLGLASDALSVIAALTKGVTTADQALVVLKAIQKFLDAFTKVSGGKITVEAAEAALEKLRANLRANDAAADTRLRERFGGG